MVERHCIWLNWSPLWPTSKVLLHYARLVSSEKSFCCRTTSMEQTACWHQTNNQHETVQKERNWKPSRLLVPTHNAVMQFLLNRLLFRILLYHHHHLNVHFIPRLIKGMDGNSIIIKSWDGAYSSNIILVKKKDGLIWSCIDSRQLNQQVHESGNNNTCIYICAQNQRRPNYRSGNLRIRGAMERID